MPDDGARTKPATIWDVAERAGVSHQTVSRYLRSDDRMRAETRERVGAAIAELDYRPNLMARAMRTRRTGRLAVLLPAGPAVSSLVVVEGAASAAREAGYAVEVVTLADPPAERAARVLELADSGLYEGILALTPLPSPDSGRRVTGAPVVVSPEYDDARRSMGVIADGSAAAELVERLAALGHRRLLHVAGDYRHTSARNRRDVVVRTAERLGLEPVRVVDGDWSAESGLRAVLALPQDSGVTAVVAANDVVAAGVLRGAWERGWRVPDDLSVTGWDDNPVTAFLAPTLTTVAIDHATVGRRAIAPLLARLRGETATVTGGPITEVRWRESVGPAPAERLAT